MIGIIDYGSGNIQAIRNIYKKLKIETKVVAKPDDLNDVSRIILPGVGAFDEAISKLDNSGIRAALDKAVLVNRLPVMGICVGMQIMADSSEEGELPGLGWIKGRVNKFDPSKIDSLPKVPHMGWNEVETKDHPIFNNIDYKFGFYFLHSYYFNADSDEIVIAQSFYGSLFHCAVNNSNIFGFQFHPEKSHHNGIQLFKNFAELELC